MQFVATSVQRQHGRDVANISKRRYQDFPRMDDVNVIEIWLADPIPRYGKVNM